MEKEITQYETQLIPEHVDDLRGHLIHLHDLAKSIEQTAGELELMIHMIDNGAVFDQQEVLRQVHQGVIENVSSLQIADSAVSFLIDYYDEGDE